MSHGCPILFETHTSGTSATNSTAGQVPNGHCRHHASNISAFKVRKAVRTLARMCDVPYHRQPLTPQLRHHMAASVAQLVEHRSRKAGVTGSSPVAGSIAQDSRLRAAFLLPILSAFAPIQASPRQQRPTRWTSCLMHRGGDLPKWNFNKKKPSCNNCHGEGSNWPYRYRIVTIYKCRETLGI